jgi:type II secretory pathway component PulF
MLIAGAFLISFIVAVFTGPIAILACGVICLFFISIAFAASSFKPSIDMEVFSTIQSCMRQNLPLPMALEQASAGRNDKNSRILLKIKDWLVKGFPLSEAIKRGHPKCPRYALSMITAAEKIGHIPDALNIIQKDLIAKEDEAKHIHPFDPTYPFVLLITIVLKMQFIVPKYLEVLNEMHEGELPFSTQLVFKISDFIRYQYGWIPFLFVFIFIYLIIPFNFHGGLLSRRLQKTPVLIKIIDFTRWHLPILHWFEKNYSLIPATEMLRISLEAGCTINQAIANALNLNLNYCFDKRLAGWLKNIEQGHNISDAARKNKLPASIAWAFDEKTNNSDAPAVLEVIEEHYRNNYTLKVNTIKFIASPCMIMTIGAIVGFTICALYSPMVSVIYHTAESFIP